jgi:hypothetical protein
MWIPKCCDQNTDLLNSKFRHTVTFNLKSLSSSNSNDIQKNKYLESQVIVKRCYIKDRSLDAQDTAINNGVRDSTDNKEFIFKYFDITSFSFNSIEWSGSKYQVIGSSKQSSVLLDGKRFVATDSLPFISGLVGLKKL